MVRGHPQGATVVFHDAPDLALKKAFPGAVGLKLAVAQPGQTRAAGANPEVVVGVFMNAHYVDRVVVGVPGHGIIDKSAILELADAAFGGQPKIAFMIFVDAATPPAA